MAGGGSPIIPFLPSSQTHQGPSRAHLHKPRRAQGHSRWFWGTQIKDSVEGTASLGPSQSCPRGPSAPASRRETHRDESTGEPFGLGGLLHRGMGCVMRCKGRAFGDSTRLTVGYLVEEPKVGKGRAPGRLGRNNCSDKWHDGVING